VKNEDSNILEKACRERGLPLTVQRRAIWEALSAHKDHPTADDIYAEVKDRLPGLSRTTAYRVLEAIVRMGLAHKVSHPGAAVRFDPILEPHHHFVCSRCDHIFDLEDPSLKRLQFRIPKSPDFEINGYSIYFRGVCSACRKGTKRRST
jgi:Fur family peroxide stress response transcriptional regulator